MLETEETKNARITSTMLGKEDHGLITYYLYLDYGGSGQGAGGYCMETYDKEKDCRVGTPLLTEHLIKIFKTLEVSKWEDLPGQNIRVRSTHSKVHSIGHFLKDKWFDLDYQGETNASTKDS